MKNSTQRTSCVHNSKKSGALSGIMQLSMAILFAFSITTQAEAIEYPSAKVSVKHDKSPISDTKSLKDFISSYALRGIYGFDTQLNL